MKKKRSSSKPWLIATAGIVFVGFAQHPAKLADGVGKSPASPVSLSRPPIHLIADDEAQPLSPLLTKIRFCESTNRYTVVNSEPVKVGDHFEYAGGAYQIIPSTWKLFNKQYPNAQSAPAQVQDQVAEELYKAQGTGPWTASRPCWSK